MMQVYERNWRWKLLVEYYRVVENLTPDEAWKKVEAIMTFVKDRG